MIKVYTILLILLLSACGGSGVGHVVPFEFAQSSVTGITTDANFTISLTSTGEGVGTITYRSSDSSIASVNSITGEVDILKGGAVDIIATKAYDGIFAEISSSYRLVINRIANTIAFTNANIVLATTDNTVQIISTTTPSQGTLTFNSNNTAAVVIVGTNTFRVVGAGIALIIATQTEDDIYLAGVATQTITVNGATQSIGFDAIVFNESVSETFTHLATTTGGAGTGRITYQSNNTNVASINANTGEVVAQTTGVVIITADKAADIVYSGTSASYTLFIRSAQSLVFALPTISTLTTANNFTNAFSDSGQGSGAISYGSSSSTIASIDNNGLVNVQAFGTVTITATKTNDNVYNQAVASYILVVTRSAQSLVFALPTISTLTTADNFTNAFSDSGQGSGAISYGSSSSTIASIDNNGLVNVQAFGTVTITATKTNDNVYNQAVASYILVVTRSAQSLVFALPTISTLTTANNFTNAFSDSGQGSGAISYGSSSSTIASIDNNGLVNVQAFGTITITATKTNDNVYNQAVASYILVVTRSAQSLVFALPTISTLTTANNFTNAFSDSGQGSGAISYGSSSSTIASIDNNGLVNVQAFGTVTITATKTNDNVYNQAVASYILVVTRSAQSLVFALPTISTLTTADNFTNAFSDSGQGSGAISYGSSSSTIASIDNNGLVNVQAFGTVTITATKTNDNVYNQAVASYILVVTRSAQSLVFALPTISTLTTANNFTNAFSDSGQGSGAISYGSSSSTIASIDNNGLVNVQAFGTITITATKTNDNVYNQAVASYILVVTRSAQSLVFALPTISTLTTADNFTNAFSDSGQGSGAISYGSSSSTIASIDNNGLVNVQAFGTITITATKTNDNVYNQAVASYTLVVLRADQAISFSNSIVNAVKTDNITNIASPNIINAGAITYTSSSSSIAIVNNSGVVSIRTVGTVTINATRATNTVYNSAYASYRLIIKPVTTTITLIAPGNGKISLMWNNVADANRYQVYYGTSPTISHTVSSTYLGIQNTTNTFTTIISLTNDTQYYFVVSVIDLTVEGDISREVSATPTVPTATIGAINDTGINFSGNISTTNQTDCSANGVGTLADNYVSQQDCNQGRDYLNRLGFLDKIGNGDDGFDFTKLNISGDPLTSQSIDWDDVGGNESTGQRWSCVRDNHTDLYWEVKLDTGTAPATITEPSTASLLDLRHKNNGFLRADIANTGVSWIILVNAFNTANICGFNDWRVPTIDEILTISDKDSAGTFAMDENYFPNIADDNLIHWTSSTTTLSATNNIYWYFDQVNGDDGYLSTNGYAHIRLVRGATSSFRGNNRYTTQTIGNDMIVIDPTASLMWKRCSEGQTNDNNCTGSATGLTWQNALDRANNVNNNGGYAGFSDWRLPNVEELRSLVRRDSQSPSINSTIFPNVDNVNYWSNTPNKDGTRAYNINFRYGDDAISLRSNGTPKVRLVRDIQQ